MTPAARAQSGDARTQEQAKQATDAVADAAKKAAAEFAEATRVINGPAGNPECVWLGRRVVGRIWADDLDTAFRHLDMYDRFGCPGGHIQATFRCMARQGGPSAKQDAGINAQISACWLNPGAPPPATPAAATTPPAAPAQASPPAK